jgi:serine/threonine protein kinase
MAENSEQNSLPLLFKNFLENQSGNMSFTSNGDLKENSNYKMNFNELTKIGEGTFGVVILVRDNEKNLDSVESQKQAIKKFRLTYCCEAKLFRMFEDIIALKSIDNERVVKLFDAWLEIESLSNEVFLFVRMELCDGNLKKLLEYIRNDKSMKETHDLTLLGYHFASDIFIQILEAVNYLHKRKAKIIHGNLKPENILFKKVNNSMFIKIADTGLRIADEFSLRKQMITKDEKYSAPEVLNDKKYYTKSDIFSLGVIVEELLDIDLNK